MFNRTFKLTTLAIATSLLAACGGGGSSSSTPAAPTISGLAVDGPLAGATVTFTECNNATTTTKSDGTFTFPQGCTSSPVTITGGIDTATDLPFTGEIKAPKRTSNEQNTIVVSPITTLIQASITAGATPEEATTKIATALGLAGKDLLSVDPMKDQAVYAKTVAVQQMVEQIQTVVASLGGSTTQADLNTVAFSALQTALSAPTSDNNLTSTATITAAISATVEAVKEDLPAETAANLANVQTNLAALSAEVISSNVQSVETAIQNVPAATFSQGTESIKAATETVVVEAKESIAVEKIVTALAPVLTQAPAQVEDSLKAISTAVADPTAPTSNTAIANAITQIQTNVPTVTLPAETTTSVQNANDFYADYLELNGFNVQGVNQTITALNASLTNPIQVASLNNLLVGITPKGTYATTASPIVATAALNINTGTKTLTISANKLNLNFNAGTLTAATIPAGTEIKVDSTINSLKTTFTINADKDVLSNGKIALNTATLGSLSASLATQLNNFSLKGDTVTMTAVLKATPVFAITKADGSPVLASKYTLGTIDGSGVSAKFKVTQ
ncbi:MULTISPECIES: hypothetical protein [unclassified Acinetobacter]|jgi:hypothetical protein|uniref:hypothetical protein n=1 Tax=unclassified Acinetobacter TaxID=196816 RepID=UPI000A352FEF|nr:MULTISPECIES: hypothetical protein [unclassified Acinetobacter]OTG74172.1 hypothetical protein B9T38_02175 [Acinetobacter sp. ANC 4218]QQN39702.1 hypothetical protein JFY49_01750 [Acinetobacter sp. CS-2]